MNKKLVEAQRPRREYVEQMTRGSKYLMQHYILCICYTNKGAKVTIVHIPCTVLYIHSMVYIFSVRLNTVLH